MTGVGINCVCIGNGANTGTSLPDNSFATITNLTPIDGGDTLTYNTFTGLIGVATSSIRYKEDVKLFSPTFSDSVLKLEPVTFKYKNSKLPSLGLIAEEVNKYYPELTPVDHGGEPYTVNYELLSVLLLDRIKKMDLNKNITIDRISKLKTLVYNTIINRNK